jgi:glycerol-3-phosphate O-acyltransferase
MSEKSVYEDYVEPRDHIWPDIEDWPLYKLYEKRSEFVAEVNEQTLAHYQQYDADELLEIINKVMYKERVRMKRIAWKVDPPNEKLFWKKISNKLNNATSLQDRAQRKTIYEEIILRIINRYSEEIVGNFKINTFLFARKFLTFFFGRLLNAAASKGIPRIFGTRHRLQERLRLIGYVDHVRKLFDKGVVILVPTHFSNLDSILIGYVIDLVAGMPSFHYGAGLNLYNSEIAAYFMNRLGAYRIDRRKKNMIYMQTLKIMSSLSIQRGVNTIFFPGGTRSRSGKLEENVKLGLLGTCIDAQRALLEKGEDQKVFIVPVVLNYHFVLEAKFLIEEHLKSQGREKYLRSEDKSKSVFNNLKFIYKLFGSESEVITSFGQPMDVLGNLVDEDGHSIDQNGNPVKIDEYFMRNGMIVKDEQRESIYTKDLGDRILARFKKDNFVLSSHVLAYTAFKIIEEAHPDLDIFGILRLPEEEFEIKYDDFLVQLDRVVVKLRELSGQGKLRLPSGFDNSAEVIFKEGINKLGIYHGEQPLKIKGKTITSENFKLLYYYHNRMEGYGIDFNSISTAN